MSGERRAGVSSSTWLLDRESGFLSSLVMTMTVTMLDGCCAATMTVCCFACYGCSGRCAFEWLCCLVLSASFFLSYSLSPLDWSLSSSIPSAGCIHVLFSVSIFKSLGLSISWLSISLHPSIMLLRSLSSLPHPPSLVPYTRNVMYLYAVPLSSPHHRRDSATLYGTL